jgi:hypothetical protein
MSAGPCELEEFVDTFRSGVRLEVEAGAEDRERRTAMSETTKSTTAKVTPQVVRALQRRVKAFTATGATSHAPTTYQR